MAKEFLFLNSSEEVMVCMFTLDLVDDFCILLRVYVLEVYTITKI